MESLTGKKQNKTAKPRKGWAGKPQNIKLIVRVFTTQILLSLLIEARKSLEVIPTWNLGVSDLLTFNLSALGVQNIKSATLEPKNNQIRISATPTSTSKPQNYPAINAALAPLGFTNIAPQGCRTSLATHFDEQYYQLTLICNFNELFVLQINRKETNTSKQVKLATKISLSMVSTDPSRLGYKRLMLQCFSLVFHRGINSTAISCLDKYYSNKTGGNIKSMPVVMLLRWKNQTEGYQLRPLYFYGTETFSQYWTKFATGALTWDLGLMSKGGGEKPKLVVYTPLRYLDYSRKNFVFKTCFSEVPTDDDYWIDQLVNSVKLVCRYISSSFYVVSGRLESAKLKNLVKNRENSKILKLPSPEPSPDKCSQNDSSGGLRASGKGTSIIKITSINLAQPKAPPDYQFIAVAVSYDKANSNANTIIICLVDSSQLGRVSNSPKCKSSATNRLSNRYNYLDLVRLGSLVYKNDKNEIVLVIGGGISTIYAFKFDPAANTLQQFAQISSTSSRGQSCMIESYPQSVFVKFMDESDTSKIGQIYQRCLISKNPFRGNCRSIYPQYTNFFIDSGNSIGYLYTTLSIKGYISTVPVAKSYSAVIFVSQELIQSLPFEGDITVSGDTVKNLTLRLYHNDSVSFAKKQRDYSIYEGRPAKVWFDRQEVVGSFVRVSEAKLNLTDNRIFLAGLRLNSSGKGGLGGSSGSPDAPQGAEFVKVLNMGSFGFFGVLYKDSILGFKKTTLVFLKCSVEDVDPSGDQKPQIQGQNQLMCNEVSRTALSSPKTISVNTIRVFGFSLILIDYSYPPTPQMALKSPQNGPRFLKLVDLNSGKNIISPLELSASAFNLTNQFSFASAVKISSLISSYQLNISFVFNPFQSSTFNTTAAYFVRAIYDPIGKTLRPRAPTISKIFNKSTIIDEFEIGRIRGGRYIKHIKYRNLDPKNSSKYVFKLYSETPMGTSSILDCTVDSEDTGTMRYQALENTIFYSKPPGMTVFYFSNNINSANDTRNIHHLKIGAEFNIKQIWVAGRAGMVQVLMEDTSKSPARRFIVNSVLDRYDFRGRYHSRIEVDSGVFGFRASLSEDGQMIQTVLLSNQAENSLNRSRIVLTRVKNFYLKFAPNQLQSGDNGFELEAASSDGTNSTTKVHIRTLEAEEQKFDYKPKNESKTPEKVNTSTLLRIGQTIDLDKYFKINGPVANIDLGSLTKGLKNGVDYVFKSRKHQVGESSLAKFLPEEYLGGDEDSGLSDDFRARKQVLGEEEDTKASDMGGRLPRVNKNAKNRKKLNFAVISELKMKKMRVIGNWMITRMQGGGDGDPYLNLELNPQNFEKESKKSVILKIKSRAVGGAVIKVVDFRASVDPFTSTEDSTEILLTVKRRIARPRRQMADHFLEIYRSKPGPQNQSNGGGNDQGDGNGARLEDYFDLIAQIRLPSFLRQLDYRVLAMSRTSFSLIYKFKSLFLLSLYTQKTAKNNQNQNSEKLAKIEQPSQRVAQSPEDDANPPRIQLINNYEISVKYKKLITNIPDYWTARLEAYRDNENNLHHGILLLAGFFSKSWLMQFWWSADADNTFRTSIPFALFTDKVVNTHLIDCEPLRENKLPSNSPNQNLGPFLVKVQCLVAADGAFNYLTEYTFDVSRSDGMPLQLSKTIAKVVSPDSFKTLQIEAMEGIVVTKLANKNPFVQIDYKNASSCPYMVVVYRLEVGMYPWAVYSCQDLNINSTGLIPHFSAYQYNDEFLWIDHKMRGIGGGKEGVDGLDLSRMPLVTAHSTKNATVEFLRSLDFSAIQVTLKTLNGNTMLKNLGLLTSSFMTDYKITFSVNPWVWFGVMLGFLALVIYKGILVDLMTWKVFKILFGGSEEVEGGAVLGQGQNNALGGLGSQEIENLKNPKNSIKTEKNEGLDQPVIVMIPAETIEEEPEDQEADEDPEITAARRERKISYEQRRPPQILLFPKRLSIFKDSSSGNQNSSSGAFESPSPNNRFDQYSDDHDLNHSLGGNTPLTLATPLYLKRKSITLLTPMTLKTPEIGHQISGSLPEEDEGEETEEEDESLIDVSEDDSGYNLSDNTENLSRCSEVTEDSKNLGQREEEGGPGIEYRFDDSGSKEEARKAPNPKKNNLLSSFLNFSSNFAH